MSHHFPSMLKAMFILGTRPEAIKLSPVILKCRATPGFDVRVCSTGQHRSMLDGVLESFGIRPDHDLNVMREGQTLAGLTGRILERLEPVLANERPNVVVVQGDTTTTLAGALAAFYAAIAIAHVEAGLRTGNVSEPFPEEMNRVLTTRLATLHFAATPSARENLVAEGVPHDRLFVTGQSGVDAVLLIRDRLRAGALPGFNSARLDPSRKLVLVTAHRRENFGRPLEGLCRGVARLAARGDVQIVFPVHRNPSVLEPVTRLLGSAPSVSLLPPLEYVPFVDLLQRADLILTDSGGIQEEAPALGKPVLVLRNCTERTEALTEGSAKLVGTDEDSIVTEASRLLDDAEERARMSRISTVFGDGQTSGRIAHALLAWHAAQNSGHRGGNESQRKFAASA